MLGPQEASTEKKKGKKRMPRLSYRPGTALKKTDEKDKESPPNAARLEKRERTVVGQSNTLDCRSGKEKKRSLREGSSSHQEDHQQVPQIVSEIQRNYGKPAIRAAAKP